ncbi:hypothetical protein M427DRAFT_60821 [Gonapodya prolifera JEL478]|uniref:SH3 domain-containing protein n=1 Tax=Gonapodya prolifera (strain JEL478) TaxID=1344416 RepID=A0A139A3A8_GONPJ|nr:hypothetical protein M427DRAFT_60821 [Gonapodya prolifera JEL478]|eukprot:KXS11250.1 hypothetical protein M427DRAFT_60821 [Gonapodya prolifera JEL478]
MRRRLALVLLIAATTSSTSAFGRHSPILLPRQDVASCASTPTCLGLYSSCNSSFTSDTNAIVSCICSNLDSYSKCVTDCPGILGGTTLDQVKTACNMAATSSGGLSAGAIAGIIAGSVVLLLAIAGAVYFLLSRRKRATRGPRYGAGYQPMYAQPFRDTQTYTPVMVSTGPGGFGDARDEVSPGIPPVVPPFYTPPAVPGETMLPPPALARTTSRKLALAPTSPTVPPDVNVIIPPGFTPGLAYPVKTQGYQAVEQDELTVNFGDSVKVQQVYDDGWAYGFNNTTGKKGMFPWGAINGKG